MRLFLLLLLFAATIGLAPAAFSQNLREPLELRILHVSDLDRMEAQDGRGGLAKLATLVAELRAQGGPLLVTHGGDTISPSVMSSFDQGRHMIDLLNRLPLDLLMLGNHEFDFGPDVLQQRLQEAEFPAVASNLQTKEGAPFPDVDAQLLISFDGWTIGVFGLLTPHTLRSSSPGNVIILPELDVAPQQAEALREAGADFVLALAHSDWETDVKLAQQGAADLILGGHDHLLHLLSPPGGSVFLEPGGQGEHVAVITLRLAEVSPGNVEWSASYDFRSTRDVAPDPGMAARIERYQAQIQEEMSRELAVTEVQMDSRRGGMRSRETAFGNLIADALRAETGADVAFQNGGGLRAEKVYPAGSTLTVGDVLAELPFLNQVALLEVTGETLRQALEHGLSMVGQLSGRFPQLSGAELRYDPSRPAGERLVGLLVAGEPVDPTATYRLAVNGFNAEGGDGYEMLTEARRLPHPADELADSALVARYLERLGRVAPEVEGRIVALE